MAGNAREIGATAAGSMNSPMDPDIFVHALLHRPGTLAPHLTAPPPVSNRSSHGMGSCAE